MKFLLLNLIIFPLFLAHTLSAENVQNKAIHSGVRINTHPQNWKNSEIITLLKKGKMVFIHPMRDYLQSHGKKIKYTGNSLYLVELDNGLKAVFKSFPQKHLGIADGSGEVAAYEASIALGFPYIPPTIMRTIGDKKGSLQLLVETDVDSLIPGVYEAALKKASSDDVANLQLFRFVFGQFDVGPHNTLILKENNKTYLIAIDNAGICLRQHVTYGNHPFVEYYYRVQLKTNDWNEPFPFDKAKTIKEPITEEMRRVFGDKKIELYLGYHKLDKSFSVHYVIYQNRIWKQVQRSDIPFTDYLPDQTRQTLESLNLDILKKIFACAKNSDFLTPDYLQAILERRDQVLNYFQKKGTSKSRK